MRKLRVLGLSILACLAPLGCAVTPPPQPAAPSATITPRQYQPVYDAAAAVLADMGFRLDRQDHRFGRITTHPRPSPTIAEPWHRDNATVAATLASTVDHLQRRVHVMLDPVEGDTGGFTLTVEVILERQAYPLRRLNGTAERRRIDHLAAVPAEWEQRGITDHDAEPIGRDTEMERTLAAEILRRAGAQSG